MKYSKKVAITSLGLGLAIVIGATTIVPAAIQGKEKVSYEELENQLASTKKELKETKAALASCEAPTESEKHAIILEPNKSYKTNELGDSKSGKRTIPGIYVAELVDPKATGQLYTFAEGSPQDYEHHKSFGTLEPGRDTWTFVLEPNDTFRTDVPVKFYRAE